MDKILREILSSPEFAPNIVEERLLPASEGSFAPFPAELDDRIATALRNRGIKAIYTHQAEVWENVKKGRHTVVVTPTASGKTLCYNLPVLDTLLRDEKARALYLFPTKALSQDQQSELNELVGGEGRGKSEEGKVKREEGKEKSEKKSDIIDHRSDISDQISDNSSPLPTAHSPLPVSYSPIPIKVATYDGDTPESLRVSSRDTGRIIISNPDMLHAGILPNHPKWIKFFSRLKYIVIDEAHAYRGVLGSHVANTARRRSLSSAPPPSATRANLPRR